MNRFRTLASQLLSRSLQGESRSRIERELSDYLSKEYRSSIQVRSDCAGRRIAMRSGEEWISVPASLDQLHKLILEATNENHAELLEAAPTTERILPGSHSRTDSQGYAGLREI